MRDFLKNVLEPLSYLIFAIVIFVVTKNSKSVKGKVLFAYYIAVTALLTYACYIEKYTTQDNNWIYNVLFYTTISVLSYYFNAILRDKNKKRITVILWIINTIIFLLVDIVYGHFFEYNRYAYAPCYLSIVIYTLLYFDQLLRNVNEYDVLGRFDFWLVSGYLLYFLSSFFIVVFYDKVVVGQKALLWALQNVILFLSSIITLTGSIWVSRQRKLG